MAHITIRLVGQDPREVTLPRAELLDLLEDCRRLCHPDVNPHARAGEITVALNKLIADLRAATPAPVHPDLARAGEPDPAQDVQRRRARHGPGGFPPPRSIFDDGFGMGSIFDGADGGPFRR